MKRHYSTLDSLRAVAVLLVFGFHLNLPGFQGGYFGVDIFFLISGYIVTRVSIARISKSQSSDQANGIAGSNSYQLKESVGDTSGIFDWKDFFVRRVKRLWPEQMLVMGVSVVVGWKVGGGEMGGRLGLSALSQSLLSANFRFWAEAGSYFDLQARQKPLLHTWSLSVEEQFYIFFAFFLWLWTRTPLKTSLAVQLQLLLWATSLGFSAFAPVQLTSYVFYLLPFRAWQLLTGCLLARFDPNLKLFTRYIRKTGAVICCLGLFLLLGEVLLTIHLLNEVSTVLPAFLAINITALLIYLLMSLEESDSSMLLVRILSSGPITFIGEISYSIYLWHWPIICFAEKLFFDIMATKFLLGIFALTLFLATLSHKLITTPIRSIPNAKLRSSSSATLLAAACLVAFVSFCAFSIHFSCAQLSSASDDESLTFDETEYSKSETDFVNSSQRISAIPGKDQFMTNQSNSGPGANRTYHFKGDKYGLWRGEGRLCRAMECRGRMLHNCYKQGMTISANERHVVLLGDSMAFSTIPMLDKFQTEKGICTHIYASAGCGPFLEGYLPPRGGLTHSPKCRDMFQQLMTSLKFFKQEKFRAAFIVARWEYYLRRIALGKTELNSLFRYEVREKYYGKAENDGVTKGLFQEALNKTLEILQNYTEKIVIFSQWPVYHSINGIPVVCKANCEKYSRPKKKFDAIMTRGWIEETIKGNANVIYYDTAPLFCGNETCSVFVEGERAYSDQVHLSVYGAQVIAEEIKKRVLKKLNL